MDTLKLSRAFFALGLIGLGVLSLAYGDFALQWQPVATWVPARHLLAYASGVILVGAAAGLLWGRTAIVASRVLFVYSLLWLVLLKLPHIALAPLVEANWMGSAEIVVIVAAGWVLVALLSSATTQPVIGDRWTRVAQLAFGASLIPLGISHFVYSTQTIAFVPSWLPFRAGWAYLGGAGHIAAGLGVLFGVVPRLAARLEAAMIGVFTVLVWGPAAVTAPTRLQWTALFVSWTIAAAAWVVAESIVPAKTSRRDETPESIPAGRLPLSPPRAREKSAHS
jgi:uncharacterized membrane protein